MNQNKYSHLDDDQLLKFQEEQEIQKLLRKSKKEFDKKNRKQQALLDKQELLAKLNSQLSHKRENERHLEAALIDSEKLYSAEKNQDSAKQMEQDRQLGLFGDYPEINSALDRNYNSLLRIDNLRKNEVIPDNFVHISDSDK